MICVSCIHLKITDPSYFLAYRNGLATNTLLTHVVEEALARAELEYVTCLLTPCSLFVIAEMCWFPRRLQKLVSQKKRNLAIIKIRCLCL